MGPTRAWLKAPVVWFFGTWGQRLVAKSGKSNPLESFPKHPRLWWHKFMGVGKQCPSGGGVGHWRANGNPWPRPLRVLPEDLLHKGSNVRLLGFVQCEEWVLLAGQEKPVTMSKSSEARQRCPCLPKASLAPVCFTCPGPVSLPGDLLCLLLEPPSPGSPLS